MLHSKLAIKPIRKRVEVNRNDRIADVNNNDKSSNITTTNNNNDDDDGDVHKNKQQKMKHKVPLNDDDDNDNSNNNFIDISLHDISNNDYESKKTDSFEDQNSNKRTLEEIIILSEDDNDNHNLKYDRITNNIKIITTLDENLNIKDKNKADCNMSIKCLICGLNMEKMTESEKGGHMNRCLDKEDHRLITKRSKIDNKKNTNTKTNTIIINSDDDDDDIFIRQSKTKDRKKPAIGRQSKLSLASNKLKCVVDDPPTTNKDDNITKNMTSDELELYNFRLQLGELASKEADIRNKKMQITKAIKKLTKKINQSSDYKLLNQENSNVIDVLHVLFPRIGNAIDMVDEVYNNDSNNKCPLWTLAQQQNSFDKLAAEKRIDENSYLNLEKEVVSTPIDEENNDMNDNNDGSDFNHTTINEKSLLSQFNDILQQVETLNPNASVKAADFLKSLLHNDITAEVDNDSQSLETWLQKADDINASEFIQSFLSDNCIDYIDIESLVSSSLSPIQISNNISKSINMIDRILQQIDVSNSNNDHITYVFICRFLLSYIRIMMKMKMSDENKCIHNNIDIDNSTQLNTEISMDTIDNDKANNNNSNDNNDDVTTNTNNTRIQENEIFYIADEDHQAIMVTISSSGKKVDSSSKSQSERKFVFVDVLANVNDDFYCNDDSNTGYEHVTSSFPFDCTDTQVETIDIISSDDEIVPLATRLKNGVEKNSIGNNNLNLQTYSQQDLKNILSSKQEPNFNSLSDDQIQFIAKTYGLKSQPKQTLILILQKMWLRTNSSQNMITTTTTNSTTTITNLSHGISSSQKNSTMTAQQLCDYFKKSENINLYEKIVNFIPIDLDETHQRLKCQGYHISKESLKDILHENNIFFSYGKNN